MAEQNSKELAKELAANLSEVADRLDCATNLGEFIAALEAHRRVWQGADRVKPNLRYLVPDQLVEFSLAATRQGHKCLSDHEVEQLIHIDRFVSAAISKACPL